MDGSNWFNYWTAIPGIKDSDHTMFALADEGYDVFIGNNRGTKYSNINSKYPDADNPSSANYETQNAAKYDFGWYEMGKYDVPAMLNKAAEVSGVEKVTYAGYSQGTSQFLYALAVNEPTVNAKVDRAILMAPCLYVTAEDTDMENYDLIFPVYAAEKVKMFASPNKDLDKAKICQPQEGDVLADKREKACSLITMMNEYGEGQPLKSEEQFMQVAISNRFQEFKLDFNEDDMIAPLLEPGIKENSVPVRLVAAQKDKLCDLTQAYRIYKELGGEVNFTKVDDVESDHQYFLNYIIKPEMLAILRDELTDTEFSSAFAVTATSAIIAAITAMSF